MLRCIIEGRNLVHNEETEYDIAEGAVFTENYNETLDSGTILLSQLPAEIEIEPYDVVVVNSTEDSEFKIIEKRMCVDTVQCTQTSLNPPLYQYEISLFSETKLLEGILLPSLAITKRKTNPLSVYDYLVQYRDEYGTKLESGASGAYGEKFTFGHNILDENDTVASRFGAISCPEMQWNGPTLREVINDLMMIDDCIPVVRNDVIHFIDITQVGDPISADQAKGVNYIKKSRSSEDYVSEIKTKLQNSTGEETVKICERTTFRNHDAYLLTTENVRVETSLPVWNLIRAVMWIEMTIYADVYKKSTGDLYAEDKLATGWCSRTLFGGSDDVILEYGEWQTKDVYYQGASWIPSVTDLTTDYQNTCLYYRRNAKGIHNFDAKYEFSVFWVPGTVSVLEMLSRYQTTIYEDQMTAIFFEQHPEYDPDEYYIRIKSGGAFGDDFWRKMQFEVEYEALGEHAFFATKSPFPRNRRQIVDNQTQSYINVNRQGMLEYLKAKRLGNTLKLINGRYECDEEDIPQLANTVGGSIIFMKQISVYKHHLDANYQATENYVLRDYFTGVKSKLRSWPIVSGEEAFIGADVIKFFVNEDIDTIDSSGVLIPSNPNLNWYLENFNYCVVRFTLESGQYKPSHGEITWEGDDYGVNGYMVEFQKAICGNSVIFTFKMLDNAVVGKYVIDDNYLIKDAVLPQDKVYGMAQNNCPYVDENGENIGGVIEFYKDFDMGDAGLIPFSNLLPGVNTALEMGNRVARIPFHFHKDNKEITQITVQFELNEDANDIFLGFKS